MLLLATVMWGYSFPAGKALLLALAAELPGRSGWFFDAATLSVRFGIAALILWALRPRFMLRVTADEWSEGIGLGLTMGIGMLFQFDGLHHTTASAVAFLTQGSAVLVPIYVMVRDRQRPPPRTVLCVAMVMAGVSILGRFDFQTLRFGRGEAETLLSAVIFTAAILWLDRAHFRRNHRGRVSMVMFAVIALVLAPVWLWHARSPADLQVLWASWPIAVIFASLLCLCSLFAFLTMNKWQPHLDATTAGIVYTTEPLLGTGFALFLPSPLSRWLGIAYENERFTVNLFIGGLLITAANVIIALQPAPHQTPISDAID